jgi:plasmid maintenance system antidote protein VapI
MNIATVSRVNRIAKEIDQLNPVQRLNILSHIIASMKKDVVPETATNLTALQGLGKELWTNIDVESYVSNERNAWN